LDAIDLGDLTAVAEDLTLPSPTTDGVAVTWSTSDDSVITNAGVITVPHYGQGDATATLTASGTLNSTTLTRNFTVVVAEETVSAYLTRIGNSIIITNSDSITSDFLVPGYYGAGETQATITWVSANTDIAVISDTTNVDGFYTVTITRPQVDDGGVNTTVVLTATISVGENDLDVDKSILVLAESSSTPVDTIAEGMALTLGTNVKWQGMTIFGVGSDGFFFTDGTDLMFVYSSALAETVTAGEVYDIVGPVKLYNNIPEVQDIGSVVVKLEESEASASTLAPTEATISEIIANHQGYDGTNPMQFAYYRVTAKSFYFDNPKGASYNTYLVPTDDTVLDKTEAIRIYYKSNKDYVAALWGENITLNVVLFGYNSGADYLDWYAYFFGTPDDIEVAFATDQDAVDAALDSLIIPDAILADTTLNLPASLYGVALTYSSNNETVVNSTTGVVDMSTVTTQISVTLTVNASKGMATGTQTFTIKVGEVPLTDIATAMANVGQNVRFQGIITKVDGNNFFVQDLTGGVEVYVGSNTAYSAITVIGNLVEVEGKMYNYHGLLETSPTTKVTLISEDQTLPTAFDVDGANNPLLLEHVGEIVNVTGLYVKTTPTVGSVAYNIYLTDGVNDVILRVDSYGANFAAINAIAGTLVAGQGVTLTAIVVGAYDVPRLMWLYTDELAIMTDQQMLDYDAANLPASLDLVTDYTFPAMTYTNITVKEISTELTSYLADGTTKLTYTAPADTVTGTVTLTLTVKGGTATQDVTIPVTVRLMSNEEKLAADKAALTLDTAVYEFDTATLPASGSLGSVITWEIISGTPAPTIDSGVLTYNYAGDAYQVVLKATLANGELLTDTKEFTIEVSPVTLSTIAEIKTMANGDKAFVEGTVFYFISNGYFVFDETGTLFVYQTAPAGTALGDKMILYGTVGYNYPSSQPEYQLGSVSIKMDVSSGNDYTQTPIAYEPGVTVPVSGQTYTVTATIDVAGDVYLYNGATLIGKVYYRSTINDSYNALKAADGAEVTVDMVYYYTNNDSYAPGGAAVLIHFVYMGGYAGITMTDGQAILADSGLLPDSLTLDADYVLPTANFGSTFTVTGVTGDAATYIDYTTTPGTLLVTEPAADVTGTITVQVSKGETAPQDVTISVTVKAPVSGATTVLAAYTGSTTTNMVDGNNATSVGLDDSIFNVVSTKRVLNPLHIGLNSAGQIRLYGSSDGAGNILTISIDSAYTITSVEFTFGTTVTNALIKTGTTEQLNGMLTASSTLLYDGLSVSEFSIQDVVVGASSQIYILSIEITYIAN